MNILKKQFIISVSATKSEMIWSKMIGLSENVHF